MSMLRIVVRDSINLCKPYSSSAHSFLVGVFNCDKTIHAVKLLTGIGPGGGRIYGEVEVPAGSYYVVGFATCKNVWTNTAMVVVGCEQVVCVNLVPRRFEQCMGEFRHAIIAALASGAGGYSFSSPEREIPPEMIEALHETRGALERLGKFLPEFDMPLTLEDLEQAKASEEVIHLWHKLMEG
jgi:hypothetical protein